MWGGYPYEGTATIDNVWLLGSYECGDCPNWYATQLVMYSYTNWKAMCYDHGGNNHGAVWRYFRESLEEGQWAVDGTSTENEFCDAVGNAYSNGFA